ncbi:MAG: hypothetical protein ACJ73S_15455 [Mycobacteriales bacterium]
MPCELASTFVIDLSEAMQAVLEWEQMVSADQVDLREPALLALAAKLPERVNMILIKDRGAQHILALREGLTMTREITDEMTKLLQCALSASPERD